MTIMRDAGEMLFFLYKGYLQIGELPLGEFNKTCGWENVKFRNALKFLEREGLLKVNYEIGGGIFSTNTEIENKGIKSIENEKCFKDIFGFERPILN